MNAMERAVASVTFGEGDRVCTMPQGFGHAATVIGAPLGDYIRDGELIAKGQLAAMERYGYDVVYSVADVNIETEAVGSVLEYAHDDYATVSRHVVQDRSDLASLQVPNPTTDGRMPELLKAASILRREVGDEMMVTGCVMGPLTIATQMMGIENALFLAMDHPEDFEKLMDFATAVTTAFGTAQIDAGAHAVIVFNPSCSPAVVPPAFFREIEQPRLKRVFQALTEAGGAVNWIAVAGPTAPNFPGYVEAGVQLACIDYYVSGEEAARLLPETCVGGNIRPMDFENCDPDDIARQSVELLDAMAHRSGFILSSGCEIPPKSKPENIDALVTAVLA